MSSPETDLTESGELPGGVVVSGTRHCSFTLRLPTVQDNIDAVDEVGSHNGVALNVAIMSRQLVQLGTLGPKEIDFALLAGMHPKDFNALEDAATRLEKKRMAAVAANKTSSAFASSSSAPPA